MSGDALVLFLAVAVIIFAVVTAVTKSPVLGIIAAVVVVVVVAALIYQPIAGPAGNNGNGVVGHFDAFGKWVASQ